MSPVGSATPESTFAECAALYKGCALCLKGGIILSAIRKLNNGLSRAEDIVISIAFAIVFIVICAQVVMRFIFNNPLTWSEEFSRYTYVWIVWLGCASCASRRGHTRITVLYDRFPPRMQRVCTVICDIIIIAVLLYILPYSLQFSIRQSMFKSGVMRVPMTVVFLPVAVSCVLTSLQVLLSCILYIFEPKEA